MMPANTGVYICNVIVPILTSYCHKFTLKVMSRSEFRI